MQTHRILRGFLTGVLSLSLIAPLIGQPAKPASASAKWLRISTNRDRLMLTKPNRKRIRYYHHDKGLRVRKTGNYRYHHRLYYRVTFKNGRRNQTVYVLASQTRKLAKHNSLDAVTTGRTRRTKRHARPIRRRHVARHQKAAKQANPTYQAPKMSTTKWYTTDSPQSVSNLNGFNQQIQNESFNDVQQDRADHNKRPLVLKHNLNQLANLRAKQAFFHFSHFEGNQDTFNNAYFTKDAKRFGVNPRRVSWGENISRTDANGSADQIADQLNDGYMNQDATSDWSHRENILDNHWSKIGIGSYHSNQTNETYQTEEFIGK